jgi:hypothetical protein
MQQSSSRLRSAVARDLRVVAIGGGTGLSTVLKGLKQHVCDVPSAPTNGPRISHLCAVVTVSDDGGSSGASQSSTCSSGASQLHHRPRKMRPCFPALPASFRKGAGARGSPWQPVSGRTGFADQRLQRSRSLSLKSSPPRPHFPATTANINSGLMQTALARSWRNQHHTSKGPYPRTFRCRYPDPLPHLEAIARADVITIGPGSLFTSLIPNLLVRGIPEAIRE